ncbi:MAG: helix-turn-helix domain-containing protein [Hyphomonas sp.]
MVIREDFLRARSEPERIARRAEILDAAEKVLSDSPDDRFSISDVANRIGVSKSTIFLYFRNKEELLAAMYTRVGEAFFQRLRSRLRRGMTDMEFCEAFIDSSAECPSLVTMRAMISNTISGSLSQSFVSPTFEAIYRTRTTAVAEAEEVLGLEPGQGRVLIKAFMNLMCGAAQVSVLRYIRTEGLKPAMVEAMRASDARTSFLSGAELLMKGIRA